MADLVVGEIAVLAGVAQDLGIDRIDQLHMARQQPLEQWHRPAFQRLGQQGVVGIGEGAPGDIPGGVEVETMDVAQQAHQFCDRNGRVSVVELDGHLVRQRREFVALLQVTAKDVLQRGGTEEIFLAQPQFLAGRGGVGRIKDAGQRLGLVAFLERADVVAGVEGFQQDRIDRLGRPQAQRVDMFATPADHRRVVGRGDHPFARLPDEMRFVVLAGDGVHRAAEADFIRALAPLEFPGIAVGEPGFGKLDLPSIGHLLAEQPVHVADAIAIGGDVDGRHGFHEAGGEPAEAAIAKCRVRLQSCDDVEIDAHRGERLADFVHHAEIGHGVAHQAANEEFEREIVDPLGIVVVGRPRRFHPSVDDAVAHDQDGGRQPVMRRRHLGVLADPIGQALDDFCGQDLRIGDARLGQGQVGFAQAVDHDLASSVARLSDAAPILP